MFIKIHSKAKCPVTCKNDTYNLFVFVIQINALNGYGISSNISLERIKIISVGSLLIDFCGQLPIILRVML